MINSYLPAPFAAVEHGLFGQQGDSYLPLVSGHQVASVAPHFQLPLTQLAPPQWMAVFLTTWDTSHVSLEKPCKFFSDVYVKKLHMDFHGDCDGEHLGKLS